MERKKKEEDFDKAYNKGVQGEEDTSGCPRLASLFKSIKHNMATMRAKLKDLPMPPRESLGSSIDDSIEALKGDF